VCLDSCHLYASGYDISTPDRLSGVLDEFDRTVGIGRLGSLHVNDSLTPLGSNRDRHTNLGEGEIGPDGCAAFLSEPRFDGLPCIFEGPGAAGKQVEAEDMAHAFALREAGLAARGLSRTAARPGRPRAGRMRAPCPRPRPACPRRRALRRRRPRARARVQPPGRADD
jgi:deoxyribonuclease-4